MQAAPCATTTGLPLEIGRSHGLMLRLPFNAHLGRMAKHCVLELHIVDSHDDEARIAFRTSAGTGPHREARRKLGSEISCTENDFLD